MIKITSEEAKYLASQGIKYGDGGIAHSWNHHNRHYYLTESVYNLNILNSYRDSKKVK